MSFLSEYFARDHDLPFAVSKITLVVNTIRRPNEVCVCVCEVDRMLLKINVLRKKVLVRQNI